MHILHCYSVLKLLKHVILLEEFLAHSKNKMLATNVTNIIIILIIIIFIIISAMEYILYYL